MNIARKIINEIEIITKSKNTYTYPLIQIEIKLEELKEWVERHEEMFDHSHFRIHDKKKIDEWMAYHNKVMKE